MTVPTSLVLVGGYGSLCLALVGGGDESHNAAGELHSSGDGYDGLHHAIQNRRAVVVLVNCCARSGRAFFNALASRREEVTAL